MSIHLLNYLFSDSVIVGEFARVEKEVLSDHDQALKMNAAFDKRQRKNRKRAES